MQKAIHFGAGKIGRGFIGAVLREAGFNVVFADVNQEVIDLINKEGRYTVQIRQTVAEIEQLSLNSAELPMRLL